MITTLTKGQVPLPIDDEIRTRLEAGCADTFLHIVPTDRARLKWCREYLRKAPNRAIADLHIYALDDLVRLFFYRHLNRGRRHTGVGIQAVWTHQIMEQEQLPFLKPQSETRVPQGTARQLRDAVNQLKASGIDWQQLQADSTSRDGVVPDKLADLITFYKAYEARFGSRWVDRADIHRAVSEYLSRSPYRADRLMQTIFPGVDLVVVSGFDVFFPHDFAILTGIANLPSIKMGIALDFDEQNESLFGHVKTDYDRFLSCGFERASGEIATPDASRNSHFARNLFRTDRGASLEKLSLTDQISLLHIPDRVQEVEEIAKLIKRLALSQPSLPLDQICVTFNKLDPYAPLIREIFPLHGVPYTIECAERLENSTIIMSIFSLLEQIQGGASPQTRKEVLRSPYFQTDDWNAVIDSCGLNTELAPAAFRESLDRLMDTLKVRQQILKGSWESKTRFAAHKMNAYREFRRLIDELVEFLIMESGAEVCHPLESYISWLRLMTSQSVYQWGNPNDKGVWILPLIQTKDLSFHTVILGGLVDGEFPGVFRSDTFLPPRRRGTESEQLREDRFLFYQALTLYRKQLYLLSPQYDGDIELVPSPFIDELQRVAEIDTFTDDDRRIFSTENFLKDYGAFVWKHSEAEQVETPTVSSTMLQRLRLVAHNVRVEKSRTVTHELPQYEGQLLPNLLSPTSRHALERRRESTHSVTQLETYGECPFRYLSSEVLELKPIEDEEKELVGKEKGSLAHKILFELYNRRRDEPPISECTDAGAFEEVVKDLQQIARKHLDERAAELGIGDKRAEKLFWDIEVERFIGGHGRTGVLPAFLEAERERKFEVQPRHFEVGFGLRHEFGPTDPFLGSADAITVGEVSLSGKIDRVELGNGMFVIGDYKTGSITPKLNDILEGRSLQLPLYIAVVEQLLRNQPSIIQGFGDGPESVKGVGGIYYVLQEESKAELGIGDKAYNRKAFQVSRSGQLLPNSRYPMENTHTDSEFNALRSIVDEAVEYANQYLRSIADGDFRLTPHEQAKVCRYCSFKRICRVGVIAEDT